MDLRALLAQGARDGHSGRAHQLQHLFEVLVLGDDADHQRPLLLGLPRGAGDAGEFVLQGLHGGLDVETELVDVRRLDALEGLVAVLILAVRPQGRQMGEVDPSGEAGVEHFDRRHEVEPQQGEVVEVVAGERLAFQVGVDEPQAAEAADAAAQAADVGEGEAVGVPHDDVAHVAFAPEQDSDLPVEPAGGLGQMPGELGGDHLPRVDAAAVGALQSADLGRFDPTNVAVDLGNGCRLPIVGKNRQLRTGGE